MEFSEEELQQIFKIFKEESEEHISSINNCLIELEKRPDNKELIAELFREAHSIKGSARMLEVISIQDLAHKVEDLLGLVKDDTIPATPELIDILCRSMDNISRILSVINYNSLDYVDENSNIIVQEIEKFKQSAKKTQDDTINTDKSLKSEDEHSNNSEEIKITDNTTAQTNILKNYALGGDNSEFGIITHYFSQIDNPSQKINAINEILATINSVIQNKESDDEKILLKTISENLIFIKNNNVTVSPEMLESIKQALDVVFRSSKDYDLQLIIQRQNILKQMLELAKDNDKIFNLPDKFQNFEIKEKENSINNSKQKPNGNIEFTNFKTLRVDTKKLDKLENNVEELMVYKINNKRYLNSLNDLMNNVQDIQKNLNMLFSVSRFSDKKNPNSTSEKNLTFKFLQNQLDKVNQNVENLYSEIDALQKKFLNDDMFLNFLTDDIENLVKSIRILPLATVFHMFPRLTRDIAREQGKQVDMIITGSETSADKTIIEEIKAPLIHIIRNSIDHGIETPEERIKAGKNPTGKILLNSYTSGNVITIEVIDDGKGISLEEIKNKALSRNLLSEAELNELTEAQILNLIFWPGFTTNDTITEISGRGVGLDVVHTKLSQLDGKVSIQSQEGNGFKITIKIPITLATLKALLIKTNNQIFAITSSCVKTVMFLSDDQVLSKEGKPHIIYDNISVKLVKLSELLNFPASENSNNRHNIVVVQQDDTYLAIEVDEFIRTEEILQKKLNPPLVRVKHISGVSSLSTGETCLILNMNDIIQAALSNKEFNLSRTIFTLPDKKNKQYKVLIVDDSFTTITLENNILKNAGFKVLSANNGVEGLKKLSYEKVDIIVTDMDMPVMNGADFIKNIRLKDKITPIIVVSAANDENIKQICQELGANDYIHKKDFSEKLFLSKINLLL